MDFDRMIMLPTCAVGVQGPESEGDIYWDNVKTLLHFDSDFVDVSQSSVTWTTYYNTTISATQSVFGGSSAYTSYSTGQPYGLTAADASLTVGSGDFTWETWVYIPSSSTATVKFFELNSAFRVGVSGAGSFYALGWTTFLDDLVYHQTTLTKDAWHFIEFTRASGVCYLFLDGVLASTTPTLATNFSATDMRLGTGSWSPGTAYFDDFRVTIGVGRHTADYTVPSASFPNHS